jgi:hypothetical protein
MTKGKAEIAPLKELFHDKYLKLDKLISRGPLLMRARNRVGFKQRAILFKCKVKTKILVMLKKKNLYQQEG